MKKLIVLVALLSTLMFCAKSDNTETVNKTSIRTHFKKYISQDTLEAAGFQHFDEYYVQLLFTENTLYMLNTQDFILARFDDKKLQAIFKTNKGQAPGEMISPRSLFFYDIETITVYDASKACLFFFDVDLNLLEEKKIEADFVELSGMNGHLYGIQNFRQDNVFGYLDKRFVAIDTFVKANNQIPFKRYFPQMLNIGYFLGSGVVAHTYRLYPRKNCKVDIYDLNEKKILTSLHWKQPFSPTQKDINQLKNLYFSIYVGKHGPFYVVQNSYNKKSSGPTRYDLLIYNEKGQMRSRFEFTHLILKVQKASIETNGTNVYFMDEDEGISYIDIESLVSPS